MNATSIARSLTALGACLALAASAQAQIGPIPKGTSGKVGGSVASTANQAPECYAGPSTFVECTGQVTAIQLDGTLSYDPDGDPITFEWKLEGICNSGYLDDPTSPTPILYFDGQNNCLDECGKISLRVRDGMTSSTCKTAVVVQDMTPPDLVVPLDVVEPWGPGYPAQAAPALTGAAVATDCDPNVLTSYSDTYSTGPLPSGVEDIVQRLWRSVDECGNVAEEVQVIVFVSQSFFAGAPLDIFPGSCNNLFLTGAGLTSFDAALLAKTGFVASGVQPASLRIKRADGLGIAVAPMSTQFLELGTPSVVNSCASSVADNEMDCLMTFDHGQVVSGLLLDQQPSDSVVVVQVTGLNANGTSFKGFDLIRIKSLTAVGPPPGGQGGGQPSESLAK